MKSCFNAVTNPLLIPVLLGAALLAACAPKSYCVQQQKYDHVASIPKITGGDGLSVPTSPTALIVPPAPPPEQDAPYGNRVRDPKHPERTEYACLDEPPPMPPGADPGLGTGQ
jgi:hypothetical protein